MFKLDVLERFHKDVIKDFRPETSVKINRSEMDLLLVLSEVPNRPFGFYSRHIHLEKSSFSYIVDLLVLKGLVEKEDDELDRRKKTLILTKSGCNIVAELNTQYDTYYNKRMSIFSDEELKDLHQSLVIIKGLSRKMRMFIDSDENKANQDHHRRHRQ